MRMVVVGVYRKMHIPDDPLYYEKFYFTPGDLGFQNFETRYLADRRAGVLGPVVSGRSTHHQPARRERFVLSDRDRLASGGKAAVWRSSTQQMK